MIAPCKGCVDRRVGCQSVCEKYKEFKEANDKRKEAIYREKSVQGYFLRKRRIY